MISDIILSWRPSTPLSIIARKDESCPSVHVYSLDNHLVLFMYPGIQEDLRKIADMLDSLPVPAVGSLVDEVV